MSIYKRGQTYWIQFTDSTGERIQRSAGTSDKQQAQELHDKLKAESWRVKKLGDKPRYTWQDAVVRWLKEQSHKKSIEDDKKQLRWLDSYLNGKYLVEITKPVIEQIKTIKQESGVTNATVNRVLALLRSILNRAVKDWEWLDNVPTVRLLPEPTQQVRWLTELEAKRLLKELPLHIEIMVRFTLATGLRESNVTGLQWNQIDMARRCAWIHPEQAKAKKAIAVPLNNEAFEIVNLQIGKHLTHVFTYNGKPITRANNRAWRNALKRANIDNFRWHDLRHTWASWHIQNGTPLHVLKELGGWSSLAMVMRYAHLSSDHLKEYSENSKPVITSLRAMK